MRNLIYFLFVLLLGINGMLLWQSREEKRGTRQTCCAIPNNIDTWIDDVKTSVLPGGLGLVQ